MAMEAFADQAAAAKDYAGVVFDNEDELTWVVADGVTEAQATRMVMDQGYYEREPSEAGLVRGVLGETCHGEPWFRLQADGPVEMWECRV